MDVGRVVGRNRHGVKRVQSVCFVCLYGLYDKIRCMSRKSVCLYVCTSIHSVCL